MSQRVPARAATSPATLVVLVSSAVFITYVDRGTLATAAPLMQDELHLSATQLGILLSAFYYGYAAVMAPVSWLVERYGAQRMLALGLVVHPIGPGHFETVASPNGNLLSGLSGPQLVSSDGSRYP